MPGRVKINCAQCGEEVLKEANQVKFYRNSFCNSSCAATYNNNIGRAPKRQKTGENRKCLNCKKPVYVTRQAIELGHGKYCSHTCQHAYAWKIKKQTVLEKGVEALEHEGHLRHQTYDAILKRIIIEDYPQGESGRACWHCGWEEENKYTHKHLKDNLPSRHGERVPTQLNHIDGNPLNNKISNLEIVCPNCHSLGEFYGSRGGGGRIRLSDEKSARNKYETLQHKRKTTK